MTRLTMHDVTRVLEDAASRIEYDDPKHAYYFNGKRLPSVTTILGVLAKPALVGWAANCAVEYISAEIAAGAPITDTLLNDARGAHRRIAKEGADIGSAAHDAVAVWASGMPWDTYLPDEPRAKAATLAMLEWMDAVQLEVLASEVIVAQPGDVPTWAGRLDLVGRIGDRLCVVDLKTNRRSASSGGLYPENLLQNAAYATCVEAAMQWQVDETIVVHACREGGGWRSVTRAREEWRSDADTFHACARAYVALRDLKSVVKNPVMPGAKEAAA